MFINTHSISLQLNRMSGFCSPHISLLQTFLLPQREIIKDKTETTKVCPYVCVMQQPAPAWAGPPPPSSQIPMVEENKPSSYLGKAVENSDPAWDVILRAFRGTYPEILLDWHCTSHPHHRMWFVLQLKYPSAFRENLTSLFHVLIPLFWRVVLIFFVSTCIWLVCLSRKCVVVLVQEEERWLFLSRKTSLRKRSLKHLVDEAHCLQPGATHRNITGQCNREKCFLSVKRKIQVDFSLNPFIKD